SRQAGRRDAGTARRGQNDERKRETRGESARARQGRAGRRLEIEDGQDAAAGWQEGASPRALRGDPQDLSQHRSRQGSEGIAREVEVTPFVSAQHQTSRLDARLTQ